MLPFNTQTMGTETQGGALRSVVGRSKIHISVYWGYERALDEIRPM